MRTILEFINNKNIIKYKYFPETKEELKKIIEDRIKQEGNECDLNDINVSKITDMSEMFFNSKFNGDIAKWNVSNVINMKYMFGHSSFNQDISKWNVSNVTNMSGMFYKSRFNGDISNWNVSNVENMERMFYDAKFNQDISNWNVFGLLNSRNVFNSILAMFASSPLEHKEPAWYKEIKSSSNL